MNSYVLTLVSIFLYLVNIGLAMDKKEAIALCIQKYPVSEDMYIHFKQNGVVPNENDMNQKCTFHCILNKFGMVDDNGNLDLPKLKEMMIQKYEKMSAENVSALVEKCAVRSETEPCEKIYQFTKCHMQAYLDFVKG